MTMEKEALQALSTLFGHTIKENPELLKIMDDAKKKVITEAEAMTKMMALVQSNPELSQKLMGHASKDLAPLREDQLPIGPTQEGVGDPNTPFYSRPGGLPGINPLYTGKIIERLQFDNDIPELRTGPKEMGHLPAVGVVSDSRNPVALGLMMKKAETELGAEVDALEMKRRQQIEGVAEGTSTNVALMRQHSDLIAKHGKDAAVEMMLYGSAETDHSSYRRGAVPAPRSVPFPEASQLLQLPKQEARDAAWKMLSSTQGRRTGLVAVRGIIVSHLASKNINIRWREFEKTTPSDHIKAAHKWSVSITGAQNLQAGFSILNTAGMALAVNLVQQMDGQHIPKDLTLEITPVNQISDRDVGWAARLVSTLKPKELDNDTKKTN